MAEIKVLSSIATKEAYLELVPQFESGSGHKVSTTWVGTTAIMQRMAAGERYDLIVISSTELDELIRLGRIVAGSLVDLATSGGLNFDSLQASEYALNGRQVYMLMDLTPGVLFTQEASGQSGFSGTRGWDATDQYVMSGGVRGSNSFSLNGAPTEIFSPVSASSSSG